MADADVHVESARDGVGVITLSRPEVRNALRWETWELFVDALRRLASDDDTRAVVITGAGGAFSSGGDLKSMGREGSGPFGSAARLALAHTAITELATSAKPTIAAVEGPAVGVGWSIALAADFTVAGGDAYFFAPQVERNLVPDGGVAWFLARSVGAHRARELLLLGRRVTAVRAHELGLVVQVVEPGRALAVAVALAESLPAAAGPIAACKQHVRLAAELSLESFLDGELTSAATIGIRPPDPSKTRPEGA